MFGIFPSFMWLRSYPKRWYHPQRSGSFSLVEPFWKFPLRHSHDAKSSQINYQNQLRGTLQDGTVPEWAMRSEADSVPSSIRAEDHWLSDLRQKCVPFASCTQKPEISSTGLVWPEFWGRIHCSLLQASDHLKFLLFLGLRLPDSSLQPPPPLVWPSVPLCWSPLQLYHVITTWFGLICKSLIPSFKTLVLYKESELNGWHFSWSYMQTQPSVRTHLLTKSRCSLDLGASLCVEAGGHCWVSFSITLPLFVRHCLSLQLELADLARTAGKETPDIYLSLSPQFWGYRCTTVPRVFMSILEAQRQALVFQWQVLCQLSTPVFYKWIIYLCPTCICSDLWTFHSPSTYSLFPLSY